MNIINVSVNQMMKYLISEGFSVKVSGDYNVTVKGFCSLNRPKSNSVTWVKHIVEGVMDNFSECKNCIVIAEKSFFVPAENICFIETDDPKAVFFSILGKFWGEQPKYGIEKNSTILSKHIADKVSIGSNCYIGPDVTIKEGTIVEHNVTIIHKADIGKNCIIHSGTVIGTDGYGYFFSENGRPEKVIHFGDDVEIGANVCIDRGTIDDTVIEAHSKIDNLVHIAHNVQIGENVMVIAGAVICGSAVLQNCSYIAPGGIVKNQLVVGRDALVGMGAVVTHSVADKAVVTGIPAREIRKLQKNDK